jgi:hypothetical protein
MNMGHASSQDLARVSRIGGAEPTDLRPRPRTSSEDSYEAGLSRYLLDPGVDVVEVDRPNRQLRHREGKSDPTDVPLQWQPT